MGEFRIIKKKLLPAISKVNITYIIGKQASPEVPG
jgi:hypothetical protein